MIDILREQTRYVVTVDAIEAELRFRDDGGRRIATHTGVPKPIGGRGIAGALTRRFLDDARADGVLVVPACRYVDVWMARHSGYEDLRA